jgi:hypothetical protein
LTSADFPYRDNFPTLTNAQIDSAIAIVSADWYGYTTLWASLPGAVQLAKRNNLLANLVGWWLCMQYPGYVVGIVSDGGKPLSSKSIGGTSLSYLDLGGQDGLKPLLSNSFGIQALIAITSSPERNTIYG